MKRRNKSHPWADHPELLTSMRRPGDLYRKAEWNFERYEDAIFARPCDSETVMYAALDFCVTLVALRDWTKKQLLQDVRQAGKALPANMATAADFQSFIAKRVPWQRAIEAIANTSKHARYNDDGWEKGIAMPASFFPDDLRAEHDACTDGMQLLRFMRKHQDATWWDLSLRQHGDENATPGYLALGDALDQWQGVLVELGYRGAECLAAAFRRVG